MPRLMRASRRRFLAAAAALALAPTSRGTGGAPLPTAFLSCHTDGSRHHWVSGLDVSGAIRFELPLPGRGHSAGARPGTTHAVVLARRPGVYAMVIDRESGICVQRFEASPGRHFYGHGAFSGDGRRLFTTENDFDGERGALGVRDATDGYRRIGELPSHGIGPHELRFLPDGRTLAIANGGIRTHPDTGRAKLDLDAMRPNLALVDTANGECIALHELPPSLRRLSIRKFLRSTAITVCVGGRKCSRVGSGTGNATA